MADDSRGHRLRFEAVSPAAKRIRRVPGCIEIDALKTVQKSEELKEYEKKGYFLNSGISILEPGIVQIKQWIFTYYNPETNLVVEAIVTDSVEVKEPAEATKPTNEHLAIDKIKTNSDKMLAKADLEFKKTKRPLSQVIVTITGEKPVWHMNFINKVLEIMIIDIDAETGNIIKSEVTPLTKVE